MFRLHSSYLLASILLFITEVLIALFVKDRFVRPYVGDFLVVILIYCFVKSFIRIDSIKLGIWVLLFAYAIEVLQYFSIVKRLGLEHSKLAITVIGYSFEWADIMAYTLGVISIVLIDKKLTNPSRK
jgi:hypothetical protein